MDNRTSGNISITQGLPVMSQVFRFIFPEGTTFPDTDECRRALASALDGLPNMEDIFHYEKTDSGNKPLNGGMATVRTHSHRNLFDVIAMTEDMAEKVGSLIPLLLKKFKERYGVVVTLNVTQYDEAIKPNKKERPLFYVGHNVIIGRGIKRCNAIQAMSEEERKQLAYRTVKEGIERQAAMLGIDIMDVEMPDPNGFFILNYKPVTVITKDGGHSRHGAKVKVGFFWDYALDGQWAVGAITSKGRGRIYYASKAELDALGLKRA